MVQGVEPASAIDCNFGHVKGPLWASRACSIYVNGISDFGVMAIENSIAGSLIPNYSLIDENNLKIIGEYYININHFLS